MVTIKVIKYSSYLEEDTDLINMVMTFKYWELRKDKYGYNIMPTILDDFDEEAPKDIAELFKQYYSPTLSFLSKGALEELYKLSKIDIGYRWLIDVDSNGGEIMYMIGTVDGGIQITCIDYDSMGESVDVEIGESIMEKEKYQDKMKKYDEMFWKMTKTETEFDKFYKDHQVEGLDKYEVNLIYNAMDKSVYPVEMNIPRYREYDWIAKKVLKEKNGRKLCGVTLESEGERFPHRTYVFNYYE